MKEKIHEKSVSLYEKDHPIGSLKVDFFLELIQKIKDAVVSESDNHVVKWCVDYHLKNGKMFSIEQIESNFWEYGSLELIRIMVYKDKESQEPLRSDLLFSTCRLTQAVEYFIDLIDDHVNSGILFAMNKTAMTFDQIRILKTKQLVYKSHYDYLSEMLNPFWYQVFGKTADQMWQGGMVTAHGDKAYGYKDQWQKHNIPFHHGVLLFLLSYTKEYGDRPKHESVDWVVEVYPKYLEKIKLAEQQVLKDLFGIELELKGN